MKNLFLLGLVTLISCSSGLRTIPGGVETKPGTSTEDTQALTGAGSVLTATQKIEQLVVVVTNHISTPEQVTAALTALELLGYYFSPAAPTKNLRHGTVVGHILQAGGTGTPAGNGATASTASFPGFTYDPITKGWFWDKEDHKHLVPLNLSRKAMEIIHATPESYTAQAALEEINRRLGKR